MCVNMPNFIKIGQTFAEIWRFNGFQNGGHPPSWICEIQIFLTVGAVETWSGYNTVRRKYVIVI